MIVRILGEGQWRLPEDALTELNALDDAVEQAVAANDADRLAAGIRGSVFAESRYSEIFG